MNHKIFTACFVLLFCALSLNGQITITRDDAPKVGDQLTYHYDSLSQVTPGAPGPDKTWSFTDLTAHDTSSVFIANAADGPDADLFPEANIAVVSDGVYLYGRITDEKLLSLGTALDIFETDDPLLVRFTPGQELLRFPTNYGDSYTYTYRFQIQFSGEELGIEEADSIRFRRTADETVTIDSWGSLTSPADTYETLRAHVEADYADTLFFKVGTLWIPTQSLASTSEEYRWIAKNGKANVFTVYLNEDGTVDEVEWLAESGSGGSAPVAAFSFEDDNNRGLTFTDQSTNNPTSWSWDFGDGNSSTEQNPSHTYSEDGVYNVCLTASNDAGANTSCQEITVNSMSLELLQQLYGFRLYPNPVRDHLTIELNYPDAAPVIRFSDQLGRRIHQQRLDNTTNVETTAWPAGIYPFTVFSYEGKMLGSGKVQVLPR